MLSLPFAKVIVNLSAKKVDRGFHYSIPEALAQEVQVGSRVLVPFGGRKVEGYVIELSPKAEVAKTKDVIKVLDEQPVFLPDLIELAKWIAQYYQCNLVDALHCVMPTGIKVEGKKFLRQQLPREEVELLAKNGEIDDSAMGIFNLIEDWGGEVEVGAVINRLGKSKGPRVIKILKEKAIIKEEVLFSGRVKAKTANYPQLNIEGKELEEVLLKLKNKAPKQYELLKLLMDTKGELTTPELLAQADVERGSLNTLIKKLYIRMEERVIYRDPYAHREFKNFSEMKPTIEQKKALDKINNYIEKNQHRRILLHGVTGSGKTEIYLQAIKKSLEAGRQAIVLVPEISLTPQMVERFKGRFGNQVAVLHSGLSLGERYDQWRRIRDGAVSVVVGARSAIFAPFPKLGLIIIDEEHENSYKQEDTPKYHARDVAVKRAELVKAVLILGSATPAIESYYCGLNNDYEIIALQERIDNRPLPKVELVDLREELKQGNKSILSDLLRSKIEERLAKKEQTIIFLNRRGYSTFVNCRECGLVMKCPRCDIPLTFHATNNRLCCHYCQYEIKVPQICPKCSSKYIRYFGAGTQKIEDEIGKIFPQARLVRMDVDTTGRKGDHERILAEFKEGRADIMIGTQMIAKGLDFPKVTLVGVITADTTLNLPDFRSGERSFQLLTQVAGRAGRDKLEGEVVIQTYTPEHYSIQWAQQHNYTEFYQQEIIQRQELSYPPFSSLARILITSSKEEYAIQQGNQIKDFILECKDEVWETDELEILGPSTAPIGKIKNKFRWQIIIKSSNKSKLQQVLSRLREYLTENQMVNVSVVIDVDPIGMI